MTNINIHDTAEIIPEVHHSSNGRGWITFKAKRKHWDSETEMEDIEVTMFTEDIAMLASDLSEELREGLAEMNVGI